MPYACPEAQREYQRTWIASRRAEYFADKVCASCGGVDRLELDHVDPSTKVTHAIWSWSATRRAAEIAKCQTLCYRCHKAKSAEFAFVPHGGGVRGRDKCPCRLCKDARATYARRQRAARKNKPS